MDNFEALVAKIIEKENKWVMLNVKVELSKTEKAKIGKPSIPRPDIDIVAYSPKDNCLEIWEVKSYLDSPGVKYFDISNTSEVAEGRYKILTSKLYRDVIITRLVKDWLACGLLYKKPIVKIGLAAGMIYSEDEIAIKNYFLKKRNWLLKTPSDIFHGFEMLEEGAYENDPFIIASKLIFRGFKKGYNIQ